MAKPQIVKCRYCGKEVEKDVAYKEDGTSMYYCSLTCLNSAVQKRLKKDKSNYKSEKGTDRRQLTDFIVEIYENKGVDSVRIPWELIGSQMKNMLNEHKDWNYSTLYYTLWYMITIEEKDVLDDNSISPLSLIPYYVLKAKEYYFQTKEIQDSIEKFEIEPPTIIHGTRLPQKNKYKKISF